MPYTEMLRVIQAKKAKEPSWRERLANLLEEEAKAK